MKKKTIKPRTIFQEDSLSKKNTQKMVRGKKTVPKPPTSSRVLDRVGTKPAKYFEAVGRRKTAVARVRLFTQGEKLILVNEKPFQEYFPTLGLQQIINSSLEKMKVFDKFRISVKVKGGGICAQAEAVRHGISRALVKFSPDFRKRLRKAGYLTRDSRTRERKKFGLKRARRAPQWSKR